MTRTDVPKPNWFLGVRMASYEEDRAGFDAFVTLDCGIVPVQIKTNPKKVRAWRKKHANKVRMTVVVALPPNLTEEQVRDRVFQRLMVIRFARL